MDRKTILEQIRKNCPEPADLPGIPTFHHKSPDENLEDDFSHMVLKMGGKIHHTHQSVLDLWPASEHQVYSNSRYLSIQGDIKSLQRPQDLAGLDLVFIDGEFGVAENGAIWIPDENLGHRILPFITQHLAIFLDINEIVANMHLAYRRLDLASMGYGVFIAGPSKTADIEQSLVIGAQGARSLHVILKSSSDTKHE